MLGIRVTFSPMRKSPKNLPEGSPLWVLPLGGIIIPPAATSAAPPRKGCNSGQYVRNKTPAVPWIDSRECFPDGTEGKNKTDLPSNLKWQIGLFLWLRVARVQAKRSTNEGGKFAPGDSKGRSPWRAFGDFPRDGKVTRVQGGAPASRVERRGGCNPPRKRGAQRGGAPRKRKPCQMLNLTLNKPAPQYRGVAVNDAGLPRCGRALRRIKDHLRPPVVQQGDRRGGVRRAGTHLY